jgi:hypothetical protein
VVAVRHKRANAVSRQTAQAVPEVENRPQAAVLTAVHIAGQEQKRGIPGKAKLNQGIECLLGGIVNASLHIGVMPKRLRQPFKRAIKMQVGGMYEAEFLQFDPGDVASAA